MTEQPFISHEYKRAFFIDMLDLSDKQVASMPYTKVRNKFRREYKKLFDHLYYETIRSTSETKST